MKAAPKGPGAGLGPCDSGDVSDRLTACRRLVNLLATLTPPTSGPLAPGPLTRISIDDQRDMPTIRMPYLQDVPVVHASSAVRRIIALAYFLIWAWEEHKRAAHLLQVSEAGQIVLFIDEIEAHLHPSWQRTIIRTLLSAMTTLSEQAELQVVVTTHSPLIMACVEPIFDPSSDAWFDLDLEADVVKLRRRPFERRGNADAWLTSEAFDLRSSRAPNLVNGSIRPNPGLDKTLEERARDTIDRLKLDHEELRRRRAADYTGFLRNGGNRHAATVLKRVSPFVWYEAARQDLL